MKKIIIYCTFFLSLMVNAQLDHTENHYTYDNLNRLVQVVSNGETISYTYDDIGNRQARIIGINIPNDNYRINTLGLTCVNSANGAINIQATQNYTYLVDVTSSENNYQQEFQLNQQNNRALNIENLEGGEYRIAITIEGVESDVYQQQFKLVLDEPQPLEATSKIAKDGKQFTLSIAQGTAPYTIKLNNEIIGTTNGNEFRLQGKHGDIVEVTTSKSCEGTYTETLSILDAIIMYPNPTSDVIEFVMPVLEQNNTMEIQLYDVLGKIIETVERNPENERYSLSLAHLPAGIYFAKFPSLGERTFKIIKE